MKRGLSLTAISLVLVAGALAIPSFSWYLAGIHNAEQREQAFTNEQRLKARQTAMQLAERVRNRLDTLRETESRRPFYHYQSLYHDPKGASEGAAVVPSPLAQGPGDPLIRAHFQVDPGGRLTLPGVNEEVADSDNETEIANQRAIQQELEPTVPTSSCVAALRAGKALQRVASPQKTAAATLQSKVEVLDSVAWQQNLDAAKLYTDIKKAKGAPRDNSAVQQAQASVPQGDVTIRVGTFQWCTTPIAKDDALMAVREVTTPQGILVQGFLIATEAVSESLKGAAFPARFTRGAPRLDEIGTLVSESGWRVVIDPRKAIASGHEAAEGIRTRFIQFFITSVLLAGIAGLCVVGLVWQTERLARQRSQFAASAAHELRTPLAGLRIYSEMLAEGLGDPTRAKEYARRVASEAERLGRVVANVLGFTRMERGTLRVRSEVGDLASAVRECVARQQPALEAAGSKVELSILDALPPARFDRDAVGEILQNLLDNAEKHTRSANDRTIHVSLAQENTMNRNGASLVLSVTDHGPGLPAEVRRHLFRPFTRGNCADAPAGLGLGLVLVQALARAQGGQVTYRDAPGGGAIFTVTFSA